ncbi:MAG: dienelactone hydrolase family protein [Blastocatellia bacterium]
MRYDPIPALERTTCPVLAFYGEHDLVVHTTENRPKLEAALRRVGNRDVTIKVIPGVDHGLFRVDRSQPTKPLPVHRATGYAPEVWSTVRQWLSKRR